jgi:hypothetical protein
MVKEIISVILEPEIGTKKEDLCLSFIEIFETMYGIGEIEKKSEYCLSWRTLDNNYEKIDISKEYKQSDFMTLEKYLYKKIINYDPLKWWIGIQKITKKIDDALKLNKEGYHVYK